MSLLFSVLAVLFYLRNPSVGYLLMRVDAKEFVKIIKDLAESEKARRE